MPDIDLDFPRDIREVLIPRVHERYGADRSALVAAFPDLPPARRRARPRQGAGAAAGGDREGGEDGRLPRALGGDREATSIAAIGAERPATPRWQALLSLCVEAMGLPRHASQHPGGMVISTQPLIDVCPVVPAAMEGRQIVQWDKDSCSDAGFLKIDLLGLGMLSAVERCVEEVGTDAGRVARPLAHPASTTARPSNRSAPPRTTGVFQIESRAQMQMLPRTLPAGPRRPHRAGGARPPRPDPGRRGPPLYREAQARCARIPASRSPTTTRCWSPCLRDTLGTIVFQEQVIEVAMALAGFSSAEAEGLRRAMSRKRSEDGDACPPRALPRRRRAHGVPAATAERVWAQIQGFSGFGFPKAHSAAFGLLAYQSAWLRVHRGPEFLCALLNEQPMGFYPPDALVHEAQRRGVRLAGPDANRSQVLCHVERERGGLTVRIGLGYVKGVREEEMRSLVSERERGGSYDGIADLASRSGAAHDGLERLAWAGALDDLVGKGAP